MLFNIFVNVVCGLIGILVSKLCYFYCFCGYFIYYNELMFLWDFFDVGVLDLFGFCSEFEVFGMGLGLVDGNFRFFIFIVVKFDKFVWVVIFDFWEFFFFLLLLVFLCLLCC